MRTLHTERLDGQVKIFAEWCLKSLANMWGLGSHNLVEFSFEHFDYSPTYRKAKPSSGDLLLYSKTLRQPVLKLREDLRRESAKMLKAINASIAAGTPIEAMTQIIAICNAHLDDRELVDEAYCLCFKQLTATPNKSIAITVGSIMACLLDSHLPSKIFRRHMHTQLLLNSKSACFEKAVKGLMEACADKLVEGVSMLEMRLQREKEHRAEQKQKIAQERRIAREKRLYCLISLLHSLPCPSQANNPYEICDDLYLLTVLSFGMVVPNIAYPVKEFRKGYLTRT